MPSVMYLRKVLGEVRSSKRMVYPTPCPNGTSISSATRFATDMAATRRGCVQQIIFPRWCGASSSTSSWGIYDRGAQRMRSGAWWRLATRVRADLCGLARASLADEDHYLVLLHHLAKVVAVRPHGQLLSLGENVVVPPRVLQARVRVAPAGRRSTRGRRRHVQSHALLGRVHSAAHPRTHALAQQALTAEA
jgi:hypothetical protein